MIQNNCAQCGGGYAVDETAGYQFFQCPHCGVTNGLNPAPGTQAGSTSSQPGPRSIPGQQTPAQAGSRPPQSQRPAPPPPAPQHAQPSPSSSKSSILTVMAIIGVCLIPIVMLGVVAIFWGFSSSSSSADLQAAAWEEVHAEPVEPDSTSITREHEDRQMEDRNADPRNNEEASTPASSIKLGYQPGRTYTYRLELKTEVAALPAVISGDVSLTRSKNNPHSAAAWQSGGLMDGIKKEREVQQFRYYGNVNRELGGPMTGMDMSTLMFDGQLIVDGNGEFIRSKAMELGIEQQESMLEFVFEPIESLPFVKLPEDNAQRWTENSEIEIHSVQRRMDVGLPGVPGPIFRFDKRNVDTSEFEVKTASTRVTTGYEVTQNDRSKIVLERTIKGTPTNSSGFLLTLERVDTITFDKFEGVVTKIGSSGTTTIKRDNVTVEFPLAMTITLIAGGDKELSNAKSKGSEAVAKLAKEREEREKKMAEKAIADEAKRAEILVVEFEIDRGPSAAAFSPDSRFLFCAMDDNLAVFDLERKRRVEFLEDLDEIGTIECIAVSPDGKHVLTGGYEGVVQVWTVDAAGLLDRKKQFVGHTGKIVSLDIDPTGKFVCSGDADERARLWNLESCREIVAVRDFENAVRGVRFVDGGKSVIACCSSNAVKIDVATGEVTLKRKKFRSGGYSDRVEFSPDGSKFACYSTRKITLHDTETFSQIGEFKSGSSVYGAAFSPDGKYLYTAQKRVDIWDVEKGELVHEINLAKSTGLNMVAVSPDGQYFTSGGVVSDTLGVFRSPLPKPDMGAGAALNKPAPSAGANANPDAVKNMTDPAGVAKSSATVTTLEPKLYHEYKKTRGGCNALCFSHDNRFLYVGKEGIQIFDVEKKKFVWVVKRQDEGHISSIVASSDGKWLVTGNVGLSIIVWKRDIATGKLTREAVLDGHERRVKGLAISPDGKYLVSGGSEKGKIWDLETRKELFSIAFGREVSACRVLPNGKAAVMSDGVKLKIVSLSSEPAVWKKFDSIGEQPILDSMGVSPDCRLLARTGFDGITLYDTQTGGQKGLLKGKGAKSVEFFDSQFLFVGEMGKVSLWDLNRKRKILELDCPKRDIKNVAISPNRKFIAALPDTNFASLYVFENPIAE